MCRRPSVAGRPSGTSIIPTNLSARMGARNRAAGQTRGLRGIAMRAHASGGARAADAQATDRPSRVRKAGLTRPGTESAATVPRVREKSRLEAALGTHRPVPRMRETKQRSRGVRGAWRARPPPACVRQRASGPAPAGPSHAGPSPRMRETKACTDAFVSHRARPDETIAYVHAIVSPEEYRMKTREKPGETIACMDAVISLERDLGETIACMHAFVSPRDADETKVCVHAIVSVGSGLSETKASVHAIVSPPSWPPLPPPPRPPQPHRRRGRYIAVAAATAAATAPPPPRGPGAAGQTCGLRGVSPRMRGRTGPRGRILTRHTRKRTSTAQGTPCRSFHHSSARGSWTRANA